MKKYLGNISEMDEKQKKMDQDQIFMQETNIFSDKRQQEAPVEPTQGLSKEDQEVLKKHGIKVSELEDVIDLNGDQLRNKNWHGEFEKARTNRELK